MASYRYYYLPTYVARQAPPQQNPVFRRQEEKKNVPAERKPALHACILIYNYR